MDRNDSDLILLLAAAGPCSLDSSPKKNWVEKAGGLPNYICHIAKGVMKSGKSKSQAIAIAVSRCKAWAAGGDDVDADTRAKAAAAVAEWEKLKGKNASKQIVKASREDGTQFLVLTNIGSFNTDMVRRAWDAQEREVRRAKAEAYRAEFGRDTGMDVPIHSYSWIRELWTDYVIVEVEGKEGTEYHRVPYTVSGTDVSFGDPIEVVQEWVDAPEDEGLSDVEQSLLKDIIEVGRRDVSFMATVRSAVGRG